MSRWIFLYDQTRCIGCSACQMACKDKNDLEQGMFFRRARTLEYEDGEGTVRCVHFSGGCNHCEDPACVRVCPTGAMHREPDGTVGHDPGRCIGCGACTWACPYGAPKRSQKLGVVRKCGGCPDLRERSEDPACVSACLTHCLRFADADALSEEERREYGALDLPYLPPYRDTRPSTRIRRKE